MSDLSFCGRPRLSSWAIGAELSDDRHAWVSGLTGEVHLSPPDEARQLLSLAKGEGFQLGDKRLHELTRSGLLTYQSPEHERRELMRTVANIHRNRLNRDMTYVLIPGYSCNLKCSYCFQHPARHGPRGTAWLQPEQVPTLFAGLRSAESQLCPEGGGTRSLMLFGGEPLMAAQRPLIQAILNEAHAMGINDIKAITNAYELDAFADLLGAEGISTLQITLDGPPQVHDQVRQRPDGSATFETIARHIDLALARGAAVGVRCNLDRHNLPMLPALAREMARRGWGEEGHFSAYGGLIHCGHPDVQSSDLLDDARLALAMAEMAQECPEMALFEHPGRNLVQAMRYALQEGESLLPLFRPVYCAAHNGSLVVDAGLGLHTCMETDGSPLYRVGQIDSEGEAHLERGALDHWQGRSAASNPVCARCPYALFCGGGCAVRAHEKRENLYSHYCNGYQKLFRLCLAEAAEGRVERSLTASSCDDLQAVIG